MMDIIWFVPIYLVIGIFVSLLFGKLCRTYPDDTDYVLFMYLWPILLTVIVFLLGPAELVGYLREKKKEKERNKKEEENKKKRQKLKENCAKCEFNYDLSNPEHCVRWRPDCYAKPREEKKNDQTK